MKVDIKYMAIIRRNGIAEILYQIAHYSAGTGPVFSDELFLALTNHGFETGAATAHLTGTAGNDIFIVDSLRDIVIELPNQGTDLVRAIVSHTLSANVENLTLTASAAINGTGNALNNIILGNASANILDGGAGADHMSGGAGNDTYVVDDVRDIVTELANQGIDLVRASVTHRLTANVENLTLTGSAAINGTGNALNNTLIGNSATNILDGAAGADHMSGGAGDDTYFVDNAGDNVTEVAGQGVDHVRSAITYKLGANLENLTLIGLDAINGTGNALNNSIFGNASANILDGSEGADHMSGGAGNDIYIVDNAGDTVTEFSDQGLDLVKASVTAALSANVENLLLTGIANINGTANELDNVITGNSGNNVLDGGEGADQLNGGAGDDTYIVDNSGDTVTDTSGNDTIKTTLSAFTLAAGIENLIFTGSEAFNAFGNTDSNVIKGGSGNDWITGEGGSDKLYGGAGNDTLYGNIAASFGLATDIGADVFYGGKGDDQVYVTHTSDQVIEYAGEGTDTVISTVSYALSANIENLTLAPGAGNINGTGNSLDNTITGNFGNNILDGGAGADHLIGGAGDDTYIVDNAGDVVIDASGLDTIKTTLSAFTLGADIENLTFTGVADFTGTGNELYNVITGGSGNDTLNGGDGDSLYGGAGDDTYIVDNFNSTLFEDTSGNDTIVTMNAATFYGLYFLGAFDGIENVTYLGTQDVSMSGDSGRNILTGGSGNDVFWGNVDSVYFNAPNLVSDVFIGGKGDDAYYVNNANDVVIENAGEGTDNVYSWGSYTLSANVENLYLSLANIGNFDISGNGLNNNVFGNYGDNVIDGGGGKDLLVGRFGSDHFVLHNEVGGEDTIADFWNEPYLPYYGKDLLRFSASEFGNIGTLFYGVNFFNVAKYTNGFGSGPQFILDGNDYTAPRLYFDSDGAGSSTGVLVAILNEAANYLSPSDFERIA
jgi:trimeric autotransporter adhesin